MQKFQKTTELLLNMERKGEKTKPMIKDKGIPNSIL